MIINWNGMTEKDLYDTKLYEKILLLDDDSEKNINEFELFKLAKLYKIKGDVEKKYNSFKNQFINNKKNSSIINFGDKAPVCKMSAPGYFKDENNCIRSFDKNILITATPIEPIAILKNQETGEELVKCAFLHKGKWDTFIISRETILHNGKITRIANKGVDVTSSSASILVGYIRDLLNSNDIPEYKSTSKMGWYGKDFLPYDESIEFDGEEDFKIIFDSLTSKGDLEEWKQKIGELRKNNIVLKMVMATSFGSPLLQILGLPSFITHLWGKSGGKKSVAGRIAMSIWGDNEKGKLMFMMNSTSNFYFRIAAFLNNIPCFFDELQTYNGDLNKLIMLLTEGIDRGKAKADGGVEKVKTWHNAFIFTGEDSASSYNSGGGTLNRLIQIYINKDIVDDGIGVCNFLKDNYGNAGKAFIDYIKELGEEKIRKLFKEKYDEIMELNKTEEKQAINMAVLLLADELACRCIFKDEKPLTSKNVEPYMFSKEEIDNTARSYEVFLDECEINKNKFNDSSTSEYWGVKDDYEITIITKKLQDLLTKSGFNYKKSLQGWTEKGLVEKYENGKFSRSLSKCGIKANYIVVKIKKEE